MLFHGVELRPSGDVAKQRCSSLDDACHSLLAVHHRGHCHRQGTLGLAPARIFLVRLELLFDVCSRQEREEQLKAQDRKSTRLNSSHSQISYAVFCLKKKNNTRLHRIQTYNTTT